MTRQQTLFDGSDIQTLEQIREAWETTAQEVTDLFTSCSESDFAAVREGH